MGRSNQNPILDTCLYEVQHPWGETTELAVNIAAESIYDPCDIKGNKYLLLEAFVDHRKNASALSAEDQRKVVVGRETLRKSTTCWDICCKWKVGSTLWEMLSNLHPTQVAKHVIAWGIQHEPAFKWNYLHCNT